MSSTVQRLSERQALYTVDAYGANYPVMGYDTDWVVSNAITSISAEDYFINNRYVMTVIPQSSSPVVLYCNAAGGVLEKDIGQDFVFTATLKFTHPSVRVEVELFTDLSHPESIVKTEVAGLWQTVRSNLVTTEEGFENLIARLTVTNHGSMPFYFTMPNLYNDSSFRNSGAVLAMKAAMPDFYWDYDSQSVNPHFPLFKFIDVCVGGINDAVQVYADWFEFELGELSHSTPRTQANTKSRLVNPDVFYFEYMNWIWQFIGEKIKTNIYCPDTNNPFIDDDDEYIRWQVGTSGLGRASGTRQSIRDAVQFVLSGTKFIAITPNLNNNAFRIGIKTLESETPGAFIGTPCLAVLSAAEHARPVGYEIVHETVEFVTLILDDIENGRLDNAQIVNAPPDVTTEPATSITTTTATINGTGTSNGASSTVTFTWGTDSNLVSGTTTVTALESPLASNASDAAVTAELTGLTPGTTYFFRATITNVSGTADGIIRDFTTTP
jgi:hypothetical protein